MEQKANRRTLQILSLPGRSSSPPCPTALDQPRMGPCQAKPRSRLAVDAKSQPYAHICVEYRLTGSDIASFYEPTDLLLSQIHLFAGVAIITDRYYGRDISSWCESVIHFRSRPILVYHVGYP